jgi:hypothetical protein
MRGPLCHRRLVLHPGETLVVDPADWTDTLIVVLGGELELTCHSGRHASFATKSILTLDGMPVRFIHNRGEQRLVLHLLRRDR